MNIIFEKNIVNWSIEPNLIESNRLISFDSILKKYKKLSQIKLIKIPSIQIFFKPKPIINVIIPYQIMWVLYKFIELIWMTLILIIAFKIWILFTAPLNSGVKHFVIDVSF